MAAACVLYNLLVYYTRLYISIVMDREPLLSLRRRPTILLKSLFPIFLVLCSESKTFIVEKQGLLV